MDEYAPEEESALKLRAVGRVQEGVKATVRACLASARLHIRIPPWHVGNQ